MKAAGDSLGISSNTVCYDLQVANQLVEGAVAEGYAKLDDYEQTVLDPYFEDENVREKDIRFTRHFGQESSRRRKLRSNSLRNSKQHLISITKNRKQQEGMRDLATSRTLLFRNKIGHE